MAAKGTGFINFQDLLGLNEPQAEATGQRLLDALMSEGQGVSDAIKASGNLVNSRYGTAVPGPGEYRTPPTISEQKLPEELLGRYLDQTERRMGAFNEKMRAGVQPGGLQALLRPQTGTYTNGMSALDAALVAATNGGLMPGVAAKFAGMPANFNKVREQQAQGIAAKQRKENTPPPAPPPATVGGPVVIPPPPKAPGAGWMDGTKDQWDQYYKDFGKWKQTYGGKIEPENNSALPGNITDYWTKQV